MTQLQDVLGLGDEARMNTPASVGGNWSWKLEPGALTPALARTLRPRRRPREAATAGPVG